VIAPLLPPVHRPATSTATVHGPAGPPAQTGWCGAIGCTGACEPVAGRDYHPRTASPGELRPCQICGHDTRADVCLPCFTGHRDGPRRGASRAAAGRCPVNVPGCDGNCGRYL
jgi:hypothetical protein